MVYIHDRIVMTLLNLDKFTIMEIQINGKIGYALGGGLARGLFHIGVLNVLEEFKIFPKVIVGTSMGAIVGALYASGLSAREIKELAIDLDWKQIIRLADITVPLNGLIRGNRISSLLKSVLKDIDFSNLKVKFACIATDLTTGAQVVLQEGSLIEAVRASCSLPAVFTPVKIEGRYLVDGGLVNVVPISVCREIGADFVIGVNVIPVPGETISLQEACEKYYSFNQQYSNDEEAKKLGTAEHGVLHRSRLQDMENGIRKFLLYRSSKRKKQMIDSGDSSPVNQVPILFKDPNLSEVLSQSLSIVEYRIAMENIKDADLAITPFIGNIGFWQFNRVADAITAGEIATRLAFQRDDIARIILEKHHKNI
jgi:NTE family protein